MAAAKIEVSKDDPRAYRGPTRYGVLGLSVVLGHCQHGHALRRKQRRGTTAVDSELFLSVSAYTTIPSGPSPFRPGQSTVSTYRYYGSLLRHPHV